MTLISTVAREVTGVRPAERLELATRHGGVCPRDGENPLRRLGCWGACRGPFDFAQGRLFDCAGLRFADPASLRMTGLGTGLRTGVPDGTFQIYTPR